MKPRPRPPELLDDLYQAVEIRSHWPRFLRQLAGLFNANSASFRLVDIQTPKVHRSFVHGYEPALDHYYRTQLVRHDAFREHLNRAGLRLTQSQEVIADRDFVRTEHYQRLFRPLGNFYAAGGHVLRNHDQAWQIGVHRSRQAGAFGRSDLERLQFFVPHLRRAAQLMGALDEVQHALALARGALDEASYGVMLLDASGRCQWLNRAATRAIDSNAFGLRLVQHRVAHREARVNQALRRAVTLALAPLPRSSRVVVDVDARVVLTTPLTGDLPGLAEHAGAMLLLLDPRRQRRIDLPTLRELYDLTPAEARLAAAVATGATLEAISAEFGISMNTTRTQLKAVMRKTGTGRQAELVRALLLGPALDP